MTTPTAPTPAAVHAAPHRGAARAGALWFGLFGAPLAWSLQLMVAYALAAHSCFPARAPLSRPTLGALDGIELALGAAALAVAAAAGVTALRSWRATRGELGHETGAMLEVGEGRTHFMAFAGVMTSALFLLAVLLNGASVLLLPACARP